MLLRIFVSNNEINNYLSDCGYKITTIRKLLINEYGFKNTKDILEKFSPVITEQFLKIKLSYKTSRDYSEICVYMSGLLKYITDFIHNKQMKGYMTRGFYLLYFKESDEEGGYSFDGDSTNSLIKYYIKSVYRKEILNENCFKYINYGRRKKSLYYIP